MRPQHFQQHDRWIEHVIEGRVSATANSAGATATGARRGDAVARPNPDQHHRGVMPMHCDRRRDRPCRRAAGRAANLAQQQVKLALGSRRYMAATAGRAWIAGDATDGPSRRYGMKRHPIASLSASIVAEWRIGLLFEGEPEDGLVTLPIARIRDIDAAGAVVLDEDYIPSQSEHPSFALLVRLVNEIRSLLHSRGEALARAGSGRQRGAHLVDLMVLATVNEQEARVQPLRNSSGPAPGTVVSGGTGVAAALDLHASASEQRRHTALRPSRSRRPFQRLMDELRSCCPS